MEQDKKAAKVFVDKYFPKYPDVLADIFQPKPSPLYEGQSSTGKSAAAADGNSQGKTSKSSAPKKNSGKIVYGETSVPCSYSSGVDYGCRDNYLPIKPGEDPSGPYYHDKDRKEEYEIPDPQHCRGEWWQGSLYY